MGKPTVLRTAPRLPYLPPPAAGNAAEAEPMPNGIPQGVLVRGIGGYWWVLVGIGMCSGVLAANVANVDAPKPTQEQHSRNRKNAKKGIGVGELNGIIILIENARLRAGVSAARRGGGLPSRILPDAFARRASCALALRKSDHTQRHAHAQMTIDKRWRARRCTHGRRHKQRAGRDCIANAPSCRAPVFGQSFGGKAL